jgi:hypothetical protein
VAGFQGKPTKTILRTPLTHMPLFIIYQQMARINTSLCSGCADIVFKTDGYEGQNCTKMRNLNCT